MAVRHQPGDLCRRGRALPQRRRGQHVQLRRVRLLAPVRPVHQRQRRPVPVNDHPRRWRPARCRAGHAVAADGHPAWPAPRPQPPARRPRRRRHRADGPADVEADDHRPRRQLRHPLRPVAVPRRVPVGRHRHVDGHHGRHSHGQPARPVPRQSGVQLGRHAQLRPVPVPLADLPDHPQVRRGRPDGQPVHPGDGLHAADHRVELPVRRDADPQGGDRHVVARQARQPSEPPCQPVGESPPDLGARRRRVRPARLLRVQPRHRTEQVRRRRGVHASAGRRRDVDDGQLGRRHPPWRPPTRAATS